eukprot:TRINITY_DN16676_c0_g1_i1.p1 TRINITY_DN16676_c0_g1~~TRINITY_DN16676_c0_g1_i1.p1  ORF type:complete len:344 (+),score=80.73 TRINITY_DN16676_c0_g1_i1:51-1034(+)
MHRVGITLAAALLGCEAAPVPKLNIEKGSLSVSGVSSGGAMAVQYHVANSGSVMGAGVLATPPYYCAQGVETHALTYCMSDPIGINVAELQRDAEESASKGEIDSLNLLNASKLYIETGRLDNVVLSGVVMKTEQFYQKYINQSNIMLKSNLSAEHCWPTDSFGNKCFDLKEPYINNCNYDTSGVLLNHIYGNLKPRVTPLDDGIVEFDQTLYFKGEVSLGAKGYLYIPKQCSNGTTPCKLHVSFHGCQQTVADIQDDFYTKVGLNNWAESNNIVVLYPQVKKSVLAPSNPEGCWDWWGYTNGKYAVKEGPQMQFVTSLINAITSTN